jgi:16S rRNA (guanine527-N7)-methyltransferase
VGQKGEPREHAALRLRLVDGAHMLGLELAAAQVDALMSYLMLLEKWSKVYNLTAVRTAEEALNLHLLDSLSLLPPLQRFLEDTRSQRTGSARILDVGSGAGLPAVVIAVVCPDLEVTAVDAVAKKTAFITQAAAVLGLANLKARHGRVEAIHDHFDVIVSRAFASLPDFARWTRQALAERGVWLAMKGKVPDSEIAALPAGCSVFHVEPLQVPGLAADRCLVWMRPGTQAS